MRRYLVAFDIPDDTTRKRLADLLEEYGLRVQRSVFEISLKTPRQHRQLLSQIQDLIDPEADSVRIYPQCADCAADARELGNFPDPFESAGVYYF